MSLGAASRRRVAESKAAEAAVKKESRKAAFAGPTPLASPQTMSRPEPQAESGANWSGQLRDPVVPSTTGGYHHGAVMNIADAVGHSLNEVSEGKESHSRYGAAHADLDKGYSLLGMHHTYHLQGAHDKAASALSRAADAISSAANRIKTPLDKQGVTNAFGETRRRGDLVETLGSAVHHYATTHGTTTNAAIEEPAKREAVTDMPEPDRAPKYSSAGSGMKDDRSSYFPKTKPMSGTESSPASDRLLERGIGKVDMSKAPREARTPTAAKPTDPDILKYHIHGAILGMASRGSIPLHHAVELPDSAIDAVHKFVDSKTTAQLQPHLRTSHKEFTKLHAKVQQLRVDSRAVGRTRGSANQQVGLGAYSDAPRPMERDN